MRQTWVLHSTCLPRKRPAPGITYWEWCSPPRLLEVGLQPIISEDAHVSSRTPSHAACVCVHGWGSHTELWSCQRCPDPAPKCAPRGLQSKTAAWIGAPKIACEVWTFPMQLHSRGLVNCALTGSSRCPWLLSPPPKLVLRCSLLHR